MGRMRLAGLIGLGLLGVAGSSANAATPYYQNNFEAGWLDFRWSGNSRVIQDAPIYTSFNGWHSNTVSDFLCKTPDPTLQPGEYVMMTLTFDLYIFDSWDGQTPGGSDRFMVLMNNNVLFDHSFSNMPNRPQSFREPDMVRANYGGRSTAVDAIYRNVSIDFVSPGAAGHTINLRFKDGGLGGYADESWGIDNFRLSYTIVPAPGAVGLAIAGGALMLGRRKRGA